MLLQQILHNDAWDPSPWKTWHFVKNEVLYWCSHHESYLIRHHLRNHASPICSNHWIKSHRVGKVKKELLPVFYVIPVPSLLCTTKTSKSCFFVVVVLKIRWGRNNKEQQQNWINTSLLKMYFWKQMIQHFFEGCSISFQQPSSLSFHKGGTLGWECDFTMIQQYNTHPVSLNVVPLTPPVIPYQRVESHLCGKIEKKLPPGLLIRPIVCRFRRRLAFDWLS